MTDRFVWVSDVFAGQGDVSGCVGNVLDGQEDLSDRMDVPFDCMGNVLEGQEDADG